MFYLQHLGSEPFLENTGVKALMEAHGLVLSQYYDKGVTMNSFMIDKAGEDRTLCYLSAFPGNCSALILHEISELPNHLMQECLAVSLEIGRIMGYAVLFVSGVKQDLQKTLVEENGFETILSDVLNPHSNNLNFFLVKKIPKKE